VPGGVLPIAHRGASGVAPENTKIAFVKALDMGARAIEFDVQLTRDNVPIVFHDDTLERTTDGRGRVVLELPGRAVKATATKAGYAKDTLRLKAR